MVCSYEDFSPFRVQKKTKTRKNSIPLPLPPPHPVVSSTRENLSDFFLQEGDIAIGKEISIHQR